LPPEVIVLFCIENEFGHGVKLRGVMGKVLLKLTCVHEFFSLIIDGRL